MEEEKNIRKKDNVQFYWLTIGIAIPLFWIIFRIIGFNGLNGQESHEFHRYAMAVASYLTGGPDPGTFSFPIIYSLVGAFFTFIIPDFIALQTVSLLAAALTYVNFCKILNIVYPKGTQRQRFAFLFFFCCPFFLKSSGIALPDTLMLGLMTASWLKLLQWQQRKESHLLLLSLCFGVLAIQTGINSIMLLIPVVPELISAIRKRYTIALILLAGIVITITPGIFFHAIDFKDIIHYSWISNWSPMNYFKSGFSTGDGQFSYSLPNIIFIFAVVLHPLYIFTGIFLIYFNINKQGGLPKIWNYAGIAYLLLIAGLPVQSMRLLFPVFPLLMIQMYPGYEEMMRTIKRKKQKLALFFIATAIQLFIAIKAIIPIYYTQQEEIAIAKELKSRPESTLYTFNISSALKNYDIPQDIINIWNLKNPLISGGSLFLYNPIRFQEQFKNTDPDKIYRNLKQETRLMYIKTLPNGWELYRIR
jgi:hypothetical protein